MASLNLKKHLPTKNNPLAGTFPFLSTGTFFNLKVSEFNTYGKPFEKTG